MLLGAATANVDHGPGRVQCNKTPAPEPLREKNDFGARAGPDAKNSSFRREIGKNGRDQQL